MNIVARISEDDLAAALHFEELAWRELAPQRAMVFVFQSWGDGHELVRAYDVVSNARFYGMTRPMWDRLSSRFMEETGRRLEDMVEVNQLRAETTHVTVRLGDWYDRDRLEAGESAEEIAADIQRVLVIAQDGATIEEEE